MLERLSPAWRRWVLIALFALVLWFAWTVRSVLNPIILGYFLAFVMHPLVLRLEKRGWSRRLAVNVIFVVTGLASLLIALALIWQAKSLWVELSKEQGVLERIDARVGEGVEKVEAALTRWGIEIPWDVESAPHSATPASLPNEEPIAGTDRVTQDGPLTSDAPAAEPAPPHRVGTSDLIQRLRTWLSEEGRLAGAGQAGLHAAGGVLAFLRGFFGSVFTVVTYVFLLPIYAYFLLFELERIHRFVRRYLPQRERGRIVRVSEQIGEVLSNFFRGRLLVGLLKGTLLAIGLAVAGIPYALLLGLLSGALSLIPFAGTAIGFTLSFLLGMMEFEVLGSLWRVGVVFAFGELMENYVLLPKILGESLGMHPMVVLASLMIGGAAFGMFGLLIALPLAATVIILVREFVLPAIAQEADDVGRIGRP
jgi:predicted PurR-regulated permease PerM